MLQFDSLWRQRESAKKNERTVVMAESRWYIERLFLKSEHWVGNFFNQAAKDGWTQTVSIKGLSGALKSSLHACDGLYIKQMASKTIFPKKLWRKTFIHSIELNFGLEIRRLPF